MFTIKIIGLFEINICFNEKALLPLTNFKDEITRKLIFRYKLF